MPTSNRAVTPEGRAKVGDVVVTGHGETLIVVSVIGAHELIAQQSERDRLNRAPNFWRDSIAGKCSLYGSTSGREKRNREREKAKLARQNAKVLKATA